MIALGVGRKSAAANIFAIGLNGRGDEFACIAIAAHELGRRIKGESGEVVEYEDLAIAVRTSANADGGRADFCRDAYGNLAGNAFEDEGGDTGRVERGGIAEQRVNRGSGLALHFVAAHAMHGLRRESDVPDDGNFRVNDATDVPPSIFTASAPLSLTKRAAFSRALRVPVWYEPKGMSATRKAWRTARRTARVWCNISSMVTGKVLS